MNQDFLRHDASDAYFLDKELTAIVKESYATMTSPLNAERLIPAYTKDSDGANKHEYFMHDTTGTAEFASGPDNTFPVSNAVREAFERKYETKGTSTFITFQETRASKMAMLNLAQDQVDGALLRIRQAQNDMAFFGAPEYKIDGWLTNPDVNKQPVTTTNWGPATAPDLILSELFEISDASEIATDGAVTTDSLVMPIAQYALIRSTPRSAGSDITILQYFLLNKPNMNVYAANELKGGINGLDGMIAYENNSSWFKQLKSIDFFRRPTLIKDNGYKTIFETRLGGTVIIYPESQEFRYGI